MKEKKKISKAAKRILCALLAGAVIAPTALMTTAFATSTSDTSTSEEPYYETYTALGDSMTAGLGLDEVEGNVFLAHLLYKNYYQAPETVYSALIADAMGSETYYDAAVEQSSGGIFRKNPSRGILSA